MLGISVQPWLIWPSHFKKCLERSGGFERLEVDWIKFKYFLSFN